MLLGRGVVRATESKDGRSLLQVSLMRNEQRSAVEHVQEYGFASRPPIGTEAVVLFAGGNRDHGVVIATADRRSRPPLAPAEVAIYHPSGSRVLLRSDGTVLVESATQVTLSTPTVRVEGDLVVTGNVTDKVEAGGLSMLAMRTIYNAHSHPGGVVTPKMEAAP
jgi:phage baseplate assembly protein V